MEHLRCVVERITYQNADNGYTVLKCAVKNYSDLVTVVGTMPDTHVGSYKPSRNISRSGYPTTVRAFPVRTGKEFLKSSIKRTTAGAEPESACL